MKNYTLKSTQLFSTRILVRISLLITLNIILSRFLGIMLPIVGLPIIRISFSHVPLFVAGILYGPLAGFICGFVADIIGYFINSGGGYGFAFAFSLSTGLVGMIPGLIYKIIKYKKINYNIINTIFLTFIYISLLIGLYMKGILDFRNGIFDKNGFTNIFYICLYFVIVLSFMFFKRYASKSFKNKNMLDLFEQVYFTVCITRIITSVFLNTYLLSILYGKGFLVFLPGRILTNFVLIPLLSIITTIILNVLKLEKRIVI
jgi:ECF transporter S component (folate family)